MKKAPAPSTTSITWVEILVADFPRAVAFYETVFEVSLQQLDLGDLKMATFSGRIALCCHPQFYHPGSEGPIVYFAAGEDTPALLERATAAGGEVLIPWRMISPEQGSIALFKDCEVTDRIGFSCRGLLLLRRLLLFIGSIFLGRFWPTA